MKNFWNKLNKGFLALAPIAGYTDQPFRLMCKKYGVDVTYSEMVSSEAIFHNTNSKHEARNTKQIIKNKFQINKQLIKTLKLIQFSDIERPYVVQIFGNNPEHMAYTAKYIASGMWHKDFNKIQSTKREIRNKFKTLNNNFQNSFEFRNSNLEITSIPDGIDVNMGCPVRDITKSGAGVALMKNADNAVAIVKAIKEKVKNIPVSVKTRLGWAHHDEILDFAKKIEDAGADAIAIHGRTRKEGFSGPVDWEMIGKVKNLLNIPVIGNGGIGMSYRSSAISHQFDGLMIGMGAVGRPWLFKETRIKEQGVSIDFIKKNILEHAKLYKDLKGDDFVEFRKQLVWYFKGLEGANRARKMAVKVEKYEDIVKLCEKM